MSTTQVLLIVLIVVGAPVLGVYVCVKAYGGANGERYRKRKMQGPFVPLSAEDIAEDEERIRKRQARTGREGGSE